MEDGNFNESKDPMNVFDQIKGTPKFWQKKRREMVAKIAQLGPFQFFFTLSCADKRWAENFVSILTQLGHTVSFEKSGNVDHIYDDPCVVLIDGEPAHGRIFAKKLPRTAQTCQRKCFHNHKGI